MTKREIKTAYFDGAVDSELGLSGYFYIPRSELQVGVESFIHSLPVDARKALIRNLIDSLETPRCYLCHQTMEKYPYMDVWWMCGHCEVDYNDETNEFGKWKKW